MRKNPEKVVRDILETSLRLFQEVGYDKTSILDIVEAVGVTRGAFYHHFNHHSYDLTGNIKFISLKICPLFK